MAAGAPVVKMTAVETVVVGLLRLTLHLPGSGSLKTKRMTVRSILRRVRDRFDVSAAEVGSLDRWQLADLAIACVSADPATADEVLARVLRFVEESAGEAVLSTVSTELVRV